MSERKTSRRKSDAGAGADAGARAQGATGASAGAGAQGAGDPTSAPASAPAPVPAKRKKRKAPIVVGVVVAVVVVAGAGFMAWHEQPSFCNAICHTPMDPYLPTYEAEPGQPAQDKWGNDVADASGMMAATHRAAAGSTCMDCHVPTIGEQVSEGISWISGSYEVTENDAYGLVLHEKDLGQLTVARGIEDKAFCMNESCHNMTRDDLIAATADMKFNPHEVQHEEQACSTCHKAHRASVNTCTECHNDADVPDGWLTAAQAAKVQP